MTTLSIPLTEICLNPFHVDATLLLSGGLCCAARRNTRLERPGGEWNGSGERGRTSHMVAGLACWHPILLCVPMYSRKLRGNSLWGGWGETWMHVQSDDPSLQHLPQGNAVSHMFHTVILSYGHCTTNISMLYSSNRSDFPVAPHVWCVDRGAPDRASGVAGPMWFCPEPM